MTFSDVFLPVPFLASPFDLHRRKAPRIPPKRVGGWRAEASSHRKNTVVCFCLFSCAPPPPQSRTTTYSFEVNYCSNRNYYYRAQNDYTHFFFYLRIPNYTGHLLHRAFWQEFFCVIWALPCGIFCKRQLHKRILWELIFQLLTHLFLVAQSSATGVTVAATPPCSAIRFRNPKVPRYPSPARRDTPPWPPQGLRGKCDSGVRRKGRHLDLAGCSAILARHL